MPQVKRMLISVIINFMQASFRKLAKLKKLRNIRKSSKLGADIVPSLPSRIESLAPTVKSYSKGCIKAFSTCLILFLFSNLKFILNKHFQKRFNILSFLIYSLQYLYIFVYRYPLTLILRGIPLTLI